jgi:hypothetical protein
MEPSLAKPTIADRLAVEDLFVRYTTSLDRFDIPGIENCFVEDCVLETPNHGDFHGRASICEWMQPNMRVKEMGGQFRHVISNLVIDVDGTAAKATCYLLDFLTINGRTQLLSPGLYDCDLVRVEGEWLFKRRRVVMDHPYSLPAPHQ